MNELATNGDHSRLHNARRTFNVQLRQGSRFLQGGGGEQNMSSTIAAGN